MGFAAAAETRQGLGRKSRSFFGPVLVLLKFLKSARLGEGRAEGEGKRIDRWIRPWSLYGIRTPSSVCVRVVLNHDSIYDGPMSGAAEEDGGGACTLVRGPGERIGRNRSNEDKKVREGNEEYESFEVSDGGIFWVCCLTLSVCLFCWERKARGILVGG